MATEATQPMIKELEGIALRGDTANLTDGQLLEYYVQRRDDVAFAALVHRLGPMVSGVCQRVIGHEQEEQDAFQATFVVLCRKAESVKPEQVGNWLYGVAYRTALKARAAHDRRRAHEKQVSVCLGVTTI